MTWHPHDDPNMTWYGYNDPYPVGVSSQPPEPTCDECDADISDQWDPDGDGLCDGCRDVIADDNARREWNRRNGIPWRETQAGM